ACASPSASATGDQASLDRAVAGVVISSPTRAASKAEAQIARTTRIVTAPGTTAIPRSVICSAALPKYGSLGPLTSAKLLTNCPCLHESHRQSGGPKPG